MTTMKMMITTILFAAVGLSLAQGQTTLPATQPSTRDEQAIRAVQEGRTTEANAAWWGFDEQDSTDAFQAALNSGAGKITVPNMGKPWIIRPVRMKSNTELVLEDGVVVMAKRGEFRGKSDSLITISSNLENITIRGYGATLLMHKQDYQNPPYEKAEWRMGIRIRGSRNINIYGLTIRGSGGDGIYIGADQDYPVCENIHIKDVVCDDNHRQGISVCSARNVLIEDCILKNTSGTAPSAGIDMEVHNEREVLVDVTIRNCVAENNAGPGFMVYCVHNTRNSPDLSILVDKCTVDGASVGLGVGGPQAQGPGGTIEFRDCVVRNTRDYGAYVYDKAFDHGLVKFTRCSWKNVTQTRAGITGLDPVGEAAILKTADRPNSAFLIYAKRPNFATKIGGVEFEDCELDDAHDRPWLAVAGVDSFAVRDVRGTVRVSNPHGVRIESPTRLQVRGIPAKP